MPRVLFIAEKPSQAETLARVLGLIRKVGRVFETEKGKVVPLLGHVLRAMEPDEMDAVRWGKPWRYEPLPMLPDGLRYVPDEDKKEVVKELGQYLREAEEVVIATDGGIEGEMIAREVLVYHKYRGPIKRAWLNDMTDGAVRKALNNLRRDEDTVRYYHAALARSEADWLVGMNDTRALTTRTQNRAGVLSIGRVQTPTVAIVVWRDREIAAFKPRDYYELTAAVSTESRAQLKLRHAPKEKIFERGQAEAIAAAARGFSGPLSVAHEDGKKTKAPAPYDLNTLSKAANKKWRWPAKKTLTVAQALYERHKLTTYPRTDCKYIAEDDAAKVPVITGNLLELPEFAELRGQPFKPGEYFNDKKLEGHDHGGLRPTDAAPKLAALNEDERALYLLIAAQYLASLLPPYIYDSVTVAVRVPVCVDGTEAKEVEFKASGTTPVSLGWKIVFKQGEEEESEDGETEGKKSKIPPVKDGEGASIGECKIEQDRTKPPPRYTEGTLLDAMLNVAQFVSDPKLKKILNSEDEKQKGIGTTATRGDVIAEIQSASRGYIVQSAKGELSATPKAHGLVSFLEQYRPSRVDPGETAVWQMELDAIKDGKPSDEFVRGIRESVRGDIEAIRSADPKALCSSLGVVEKGTGVMIPPPPGATDQAERELIDRGEFFVAEGWPGRFFKTAAAVDFTAEQVAQYVRAGMTGIERTVASKFKGMPPAVVKMTFDASAQPYPKLTIEWPKRAGTSEAGAGTGVTATWGKTKAEILDWGTYFTVPGVQAKDRDVHFNKKVAGHTLTAEQLAAILGGGKDGARMDRMLFRNGAGQPFRSDPNVFYNPRKAPMPGLDFAFA